MHNVLISPSVFVVLLSSFSNLIPRVSHLPAERAWERGWSFSSQSSRFSLVRKPHVASFQGRIASCRVFPLKGPLCSRPNTERVLQVIKNAVCPGRHRSEMGLQRAPRTTLTLVSETSLKTWLFRHLHENENLHFQKPLVVL